MAKNNFIYIALVVMVMSIGCSRKTAPTIIYKDKVITHFDTIETKSVDTVPCEDFNTVVFEEGQIDTFYIEVEKQILKVKTVSRHDTVYRETYIIQPAPLKSITKIDNSIHNKAKNGSAIGDGNKITTKKINWWWIFLAGYLFCHVLHKVVIPLAMRFIPFSNLISKLKFWQT